jgi:glycosyltransferase involved in cell wall biosynthesis
MSHAPALSIVVPVHDERECLEPLVRELVEVLDPAPGAYEILLVDDGSRDGSVEVMERIAAADPRVRIVRLRRRAGQTAALDAGFRAALGQAIVTMDGDLQNDPRDIPRLVAALSECDLAAGYRVARRDRWLRRAASRVANAVRNQVTRDEVIDTGCSLKALRRECLGRIKLYDGMHRFLPTLLRLEGFRVVQLPVHHRPRRAGRSKYGIGNRLFAAAADLLAVRWMKRRRLDYEVLPPSAVPRRAAATGEDSRSTTA